MADLTKKNKTELIALVEDLEKQLNTPGSGTEKLAELVEKVAEQEATIAEQGELIADLLQKNESAASGKKGFPTVVVDGKTYEITAKKFIHQQTEYTAERVAANPEIAKQLIEKGTPVMRIK
ncbi:MAG: hypothetical protein V4608_03315 [Bacteroidota bacterium]